MVVGYFKGRAKPTGRSRNKVSGNKNIHELFSEFIDDSSDDAYVVIVGRGFFDVIFFNKSCKRSKMFN